MGTALASPDLSEIKEVWRMLPVCRAVKVASVRGLVLLYTTWHSFTWGDVLSPIKRASSFRRQGLRLLVPCHMLCFTIPDAENSVFLT